MADGSALISKDPSNRRRFYFGEGIASSGAMTLDRPQGSPAVTLAVPYGHDVPWEAGSGPLGMSVIPAESVEQSERSPQFSGAVVAAATMSAALVELGFQPMPGASVVQGLRESAANLVGEAGWFQASVPVQIPREAVDDANIFAAESEAALTAYLRDRGKGPVADRIDKFLNIFAEEPDEAPIVIDSLRSLVGFVLMIPTLRTPIVGSDPEGLMELEWHLADNGNPDSFWGRGNGVVSLKFLTSGLVQYVALSGPHQKDVERLQTQGVSTKEYMLRSLGEFTSKITHA